MNRANSDSVTSITSSFLSDVLQHAIRPLAALLQPRLALPMFLLLTVMLLARVG